jgi:hypothetical protein
MSIGTFCDARFTVNFSATKVAISFLPPPPGLPYTQLAPLHYGCRICRRFQRGRRIGRRFHYHCGRRSRRFHYHHGCCNCNSRHDRRRRCLLLHCHDNCNCLYNGRRRCLDGIPNFLLLRHLHVHLLLLSRLDSNHGCCFRAARTGSRTPVMVAAAAASSSTAATIVIAAAVTAAAAIIVVTHDFLLHLSFIEVFGSGMYVCILVIAMNHCGPIHHCHCRRILLPRWLDIRLRWCFLLLHSTSCQFLGSRSTTDCPCAC